MILSSDCFLRLHPQTASHWLHCIPVSSRLIFLSPPNHITPIPTSLVLGFKASDPKWWGHLCVSCFSLRLDQFCVNQGGLKLTEICLFVSWVLGLRVCATTARPLWLTNVVSSAFWSSGKLYLLNHKPNITTVFFSVLNYLFLGQTLSLYSSSWLQSHAVLLLQPEIQDVGNYKYEPWGLAESILIYTLLIPTPGTS